MPKGGYFEKQSPAETDLNGIISVMLNNSKISGTIDKSNCEEVTIFPFFSGDFANFIEKKQPKLHVLHEGLT
jgi:hypothetical protein